MGNLKAIGNIFLINHNKLKDRLIYQHNQLTSLGLKYTRIEAIDVKEPTNFITTQVKSCYLSHLTAIRRCINYFKPCLILEDDIIIDLPLFKHFVDEMLNSTTYDWDIIHFDVPPPFVDPLITPINNMVNKTEYTLFMHAYMINPKILLDTIHQLEKGIRDIESDVDYIKDSTHIDRYMSQHIHPKRMLYTPAVPIIYQDKLRFGSSLGCLTQEQKTILKEVNV